MRPFYSILLFALASAALAQTPKPQSQVDETEILRRGNMVQPMGVIEDGPIDLIGAALAPPRDDSDKWFISMVTMRGCAACETLKTMFQKDEFLKAWVQDTDISPAYAHYGVWQWEDKVQQFRWAKIKEVYPTFPESMPCVVIQPPKNGKYGANANVAALLYWNGKEGGKAFATRMRNAIGSYILNYEKINPRRGIQQTGVVPSKDKPATAPWDPPFDVGPRVNDPRTPQPGFQIPPNTPPAPTLEEYITACPGASLEWIMKVKATGIAPAAAGIMWQQQQGGGPSLVPTTTPPMSTTTVGLTSLLGGGLLGAGILWGLQSYRTYRLSQGQKPLLTDDQFALLAGLFKQTQAKKASSRKSTSG